MKKTTITLLVCGILLYSPVLLSMVLVGCTAPAVEWHVVNKKAVSDVKTENMALQLKLEITYEQLTKVKNELVDVQLELGELQDKVRNLVVLESIIKRLDKK